MKSIITAMGNPTLNNELKKYSEYDVISEDLFYQDAVLDFLEVEDADILTLSGVLQGQWELYEFIDKIRKINNRIRIIIIMDELDSDIKCELLERGILDIYLDDTVEIEDIIEAINREEPIREKLKKSIVTVKEESATYDYSPIKIVKECQKQEVITISGVNGSGKSTIAFNLSKALSNKTNSRILVIDLDTLSGNIDELFDINKIPQNIEVLIDMDKKCGLNYAADLIKKGRFDSNVFDEIVIHDEKIDILTGNTSLYYCQEVLNEEIYEKILESAKEKYDFIIIDTSSNIFLDSTKWSLQKASKILFVIENNYLNIKKCTQFFNIVVKGWGIWKEKISLIINKESLNGLEQELVEKILEEYKVIGKIKLNAEKDKTSYDKILETINFVPKRTFVDKIMDVKENIKNIMEKSVPKINFMKGETKHVN